MDHYRWLNQESHGQLEIPGKCSNIFDILIYIYIIIVVVIISIIFIINININYYY